MIEIDHLFEFFFEIFKVAGVVKTKGSPRPCPNPGVVIIHKGWLAADVAFGINLHPFGMGVTGVFGPNHGRVDHAPYAFGAAGFYLLTQEIKSALELWMDAAHLRRIVIETMMTFTEEVNGIDMVSFQRSGEFLRVETGTHARDKRGCVKIQMDLTVGKIIHHCLLISL
jgi:hypothetical protein